MLNYIWAGLIVFSLGFALVTDVRELAQDRFRNEAALPATLSFPEEYDPDARRQPVRVGFDTGTYRQFFPTDAPDSLSSSYAGTLVQTRDGRQVRLEAGSLPPPLSTMRAFHAGDDEDPLAARLASGAELDAGGAAVALQFETVRFRKLNDIAAAALSFAETAASLALGFIGILGLMLGLVKIGEEAGLVQSLARFVQPVLSPLFPGVPKDHPALANVTLNMLANVFGLGNAATPLGIKAMEDLQSLNPKKDTATDDMVMLLALNTSSVQLVPPSLLVAIMGLQINQLFFSITLATLFSTVAGILGAYGLSRLRRFRRSSPLASDAAPLSPTE